jgi:uncharacterized RDD family membrane protein YckC
MAKLLVQESNGAREFELVDLEVNIGRELDNTLRLSDPSISRHHAVIRLGASGHEIHDLQSSNGVLLNGNKVPSAPLHDGDRITLGQMQLTFVDPPGPNSNPLGTVRIAPEEMARLWAGPEVPAPAPAATPAAPAPLPVQAQPGPAFLHPYLPSIPDSAQPLRAADGSPVRGDFRTRLLAALIDLSPMLALNLIGTALALGLMPGLGCLFGTLHLALLGAYLILVPLYWMRLGATPGKKIMRLRVVPEADPAGRIDLNGAIMRLLGYLVNGAISWFIMDLILKTLMPHALLGLRPGELILLKGLSLAASILPYLLILGAERKALEDKFSRSIVIKVDR